MWPIFMSRLVSCGSVSCVTWVSLHEERTERIERCWYVKFLVFVDCVIIFHCFLYLEK